MNRPPLHPDGAWVRRVIRRRWSIAVVAALVGAGAAPAGAQRVLLASEETLSGYTLAAAADANRLTLLGPEGERRDVVLDELLAVEFDRIAGPDSEPTLRLRNGDRLHGRLSFAEGGRIRVAAGWGAVSVSLRWCDGVRLAADAALPPPGALDVVWLANGDRVEGSVADVRAGKIHLDLAGAAVPIDLERVTAFTLADGAPPETISGSYVRLGLGGGEQISGRWVGMDEDAITIAPLWGPELAVAIPSVRRLEVLNGRLVYLSDLRPVDVEEFLYLDGSQPYQVDRSVSGRPLRLAAQTYRKGLGVHSYSSLTFSLGGGFDTFHSTLGIDNEVGDQGSVVFRVFGNGRLLFESPVLGGGDAPLAIAVPVKGVLLLRLEVDFAEAGDAADHADWAAARLVRQ